MTEPLAEDIGVLAEHIRNLLSRQSTHEVVLGDIVRWLKTPGYYAPQYGAGNPIFSQSQVDIVRVTSVDIDAGVWFGQRQRRNAAGLLIDSPNLPNIISGDYVIAGKAPTVGTKISVLFTGQDVPNPTFRDHSMIMPLGGTGFRRVRGFPIGNVAAGANFSMTVSSVLEGQYPGVSIGVWNYGGGSYSPFDMVEAEYNDTEERWEVFATPIHLACHLTRNLNGAYMVDATSLAGPGLTTTAPDVNGCVQLAVSNEDPGQLGFRFKLPSGRGRTGAVAPTMSAIVIDDAGNEGATETVEDYDLRYFGKANARGRAIPTDDGFQVVSLEDNALFAVVTLSSQFDYGNTPPSATVSAVNHWWGPPDQQKQPSISTVYDYDWAFLNAKSGDKILCVYRQTSYGDNDYQYFALQYQSQPQFVWPFVTTGTPSDGDPVSSSGGFYTGKLIRYDGGSPSSNTSYTAMTGNIKLFRCDGSIEPLQHKQRLVAFKVGYSGAEAAYAIIGEPPEAEPRGVSEGSITAATGNYTSGPITPGTGTVRLYLPTGNTAGSPWNRGGTTTVENWMFAAVITHKPVLLRVSRVTPNGTTIYEVVSEGCAAVPAS